MKNYSKNIKRANVTIMLAVLVMLAVALLVAGIPTAEAATTPTATGGAHAEAQPFASGTVTFFTNGGTPLDDVVIDLDGRSFAELLEPHQYTTTREGYTFAFWSAYDASGYTHLGYFTNDDPIPPGTKAAAARWEEISTEQPARPYYVGDMYLDTNGGNEYTLYFEDAQSTDTFQQFFDEYKDYADDDGKPTREGYVFEYWTYNGIEITGDDVLGDVFKDVPYDEPKFIVAQWSEATPEPEEPKPSDPEPGDTEPEDSEQDEPGTPPNTDKGKPDGTADTAKTESTFLTFLKTTPGIVSACGAGVVAVLSIGLVVMLIIAKVRNR